MESDEIKIECLGHDSKCALPDSSATLVDDDRRPEDFERKLSRKIDIRLMPITGDALSLV
ncbi:11446_t:CDS:2, partial [Acaulospora morrowiae]